MNYPNIESLAIGGKKVLLRLDLDVPIEDKKINTNRLAAGLKSINLLKDLGAKTIVIIGSMGRPEGRDESLSTKNLLPWFQEKLGEVTFLEEFVDVGEGTFLFENLRFWPGEKENSSEFVENLAKMGEIFVNDAFAVSHREHASVIGLPKKMPSALGVRFLAEIENLNKVFESSTHPIVVVLSGVKKDKLVYLDSFKEKADMVLVGGRLPEFLDEDYKDEKVIVGKLLPDKEDITMHTIENFEEEIERAKVILVSGPLGKFEEDGHMQGTERIFEKVAELDAFKVAGGGDTEAALEKLSLKDKFDWVSTGGGAMLEFLSKGTLPGIKAVAKQDV